jgi:GNAT superfamily N-acetyltransferase
MWTTEPSTLVVVDVTFLRMDRAPAEPAPALPPPLAVDRLRPRCGVAQYRRLYDGVGHDYLWWLRRTLPDAELDDVLADPAISVHLLHAGGEELGFFELDRRNWPSINLAYFGLMPAAIGRGVGMTFLHHAVRTAWAEGCSALTVNTCTADHPRALPNYIKAGFKVLRTVREEWPIPDRLGLPIADHLRA